MCIGDSPSMPEPTPPPPPPQEAKTPDINATRRKPSSTQTAIAGGTLLTGPSGVENSSLNTGGGSLLGG